MCTPQIPGALYDATTRCAAARAIVGALIQSLPFDNQAKPIMAEINELGDLASGAMDILDLLKKDIAAVDMEWRRLQRAQEGGAS